MATTLDFREVLRAAKVSAVHLEMRDSYLRDGLDDPSFIAWRDLGQDLPNDADSVAWRALVAETVGRGVVMRRARIVSEPVTAYIRFEYAITARHNIASGEQVRWLPRRLASDVALPGNDFWCIDAEIVIFNHFSGDGSWQDGQGMEVRREPKVASLCADAFQAVWERATPHAQFSV